MASVTQRIQSIQQPRGGYLPIKCFSKEVLDDGITLNAEENVHPSLIGIAVDYLTRFMSGNSVEQAFHISTLGAIQIGMQDKATTLKSKISGLDDDSIIVACKLAGFDVCYRSSINKYKPIEDIAPDISTFEQWLSAVFLFGGNMARLFIVNPPLKEVTLLLSIQEMEITLRKTPCGISKFQKALQHPKTPCKFLCTM